MSDLPDYLREFDDTTKTRQLIYDGCLEAVKNRFPVEDDNYRLELTDVHYDGPQDYSLEQQKQALLKSKNLRTPIRGKWRLIYKPTNTLLDEKEDTILQVPYYTNRGTVINNGNDYSIISQMRLRPGVYARRKRTGELETHFNIKPGTGRGFRFDMDPSTGVFSLTVGQSHVPLYPILKGIGVSDNDLIKSWGADVVAANAKRTDAQALQKTYRRMAGTKADENANPIAMGEFIKDAIGKYEVDPEIVARTMGIETDHLTPELLVRGAQKLLDINRGDAKPDNRDNPRFTKVYAIEDLMRERIDKDAGRLSKSLLFRVKRDNTLRRLPKNALNPYLDSFIVGSGLTMPGEEANPLSNLEQMTRMTRFGEGGIKSEAAVTAEARDVNGDWLGFVDPIQGPEGCNEPDTEVFTEKGWMRWDQVTEDTKFACLINGQLCFHKPEALHVYDYDGLLYCAKSQLVSYRVTKNHRLWTRTRAGSYQFSYACDQKGRRNLMVGGHEPYEGSHITTITLPKPENAKNCKIVKSIDVNDFAALLGWFISEGHVDRYNNRYRTCITQDKGDKADEIEALLDRLPFKYVKNAKDDVSYRFEINSKQLTCYFEKLGKSYEKHIPEEAFDYPPDARHALLASMCHGDGRKQRSGLYEYCTVSHQLALDFERLAFSLGYSSRIGKEFAKHARDQQLWIVRLHTNKERQVTEKDRFTKPYKGKVYCATVPGGLMYCRYDDYGAHWTGNSKIGVDVRASYRTFKGKDNKLYGEFTNARNGKTEYVDIGTAADRVVAFPGQDMNQPYVYAMKDDVPTKVPTNTVDYVVPSFSHMMGSNTNMNPMPTAVQGGRQFYGSKFWAQYLPQVKGQVPLVDNLMPDGKTTFSEYYGRRIGTLSSPVDGTVVAVNDNSIVVKDPLGKKHTTELVNNLPFNRLSAISYMPSVKVGQDVKAGDMIANSNYTDSQTGAINMGQNLKVAIAPYLGASFEDAHVISESAAKRLATDRLYSDEVETRNGVTANKNKYIAAFPQKFTKQQFETLDDDGIVKVGTEVHKGDPLIVAIGPRVLSSTDAQLGKLSKTLRNAFVDKAEVWEHDWPGVVTDTAMTSRGARVNVKSTPPVTIGDKLSPRFGLKGVVGKILPDDKMPRDAATNEPYDMLVNPMGFLSRVAPGQIMEVALGKVAHATGKQVRIPALPPPEGWALWTKKQLDAAGLTDSTDVFDPETGKTIKGVGDGYMFVSAFHHLAEKKASARGAESSYTQDDQPAKGGYEGAKRMSGLDLYALLAHGATDVVKDYVTVRGTRNEQYWNALRLGLPIPEPGVPFIYDKFLNTLKAGGINVVEKGNITKIMPLTDKDIDKLAGTRLITSSAMVDGDLDPVTGGLFDPGKTGGMAGNSWAAIPLPEPVPNPIMEEPIRRVLGLTVKQMEDILSGAEKLDGKTGGQALKDALSKVNVDKKIEECRHDIKTRRGSQRDNAVKVLGYLSAMKEQELSPQDWMIGKVPVIPPKFRPASKLGDVVMVADINDLYKEVIENANLFKDMHKDLPDSATTDERLNIYKSVKAAYGLGESITPEGQAKGLKGAIRQIIGTSPKFGMFQRKVISKTVDTVSRGVVTPDPNLDMDQVGIPEESAWQMYRPFVMRALVRRGYPPTTAIRMLDDKDKTAREMLEKEMEQRPVLMDRAPTWHKFNIMAFKPHIVDGNTVRVCPLIVSGFNMDFDGDTVNFHVPVSDKAVKQANEKMMPSENLISLTDLQSARHPISKEQILGLFNLTQPLTNKPVKVFRNKEEAKKAYASGEIGMNDPIEVMS